MLFYVLVGGSLESGKDKPKYRQRYSHARATDSEIKETAHFS